ncbi:CV_2116 domain-containing protein [Chromobacterium phragmitis]|uniref:CV_2116 domain-containing protein n=1 Tax=Chromobacterium phragmitis TaxID=2202141 RepID=UPI0011AEA10F|nr:hypothetical protein [Chromobacterium phragmitis]
MDFLEYRGYLVQPNSHFYPEMNKWGIGFTVAKNSGAHFSSTTFTLPDYFCDTEEDALYHGLEAAKHRVNAHLDNADGTLDALEP